MCVVCAVRTHSVFLNHFPFHPNHRSSETLFQTTFFHFAKQEFPLPSPQTSPAPVNSPCFNNFLEANHVRYLPTPPICAPHRRTRTAVFSAGQGSRCPKNFLRALSAEVFGSENYSVWLKLDSDLYIKDGGCDCPYGGACKHMAALWYAVRAQTPDGQPDETDAMIFAAR